MRLSDCVSFYVYMKIFQKVFFDFVGKLSQKCEQIPYELFFYDFLWVGGILGPKCPPTPLPSPSSASMSKFASGGKIWKQFLLMIFCKFYEKMKNDEKMY